jgi:hypothetical protein
MKLKGESIQLKIENENVNLDENMDVVVVVLDEKNELVLTNKCVEIDCDLIEDKVNVLDKKTFMEK